MGDNNNNENENENANNNNNNNENNGYNENANRYANNNNENISALTYSDLLEEVKHGRVGKVRRIFNNNRLAFNLPAEDPEVQTLLEAAVDMQHGSYFEYGPPIEMVRFLVEEAGMNVNEYARGDYSFLETIGEYGDPPRLTILDVARESAMDMGEQETIVNYLIAKGARTAEQLAAEAAAAAAAAAVPVQQAGKRRSRRSHKNRSRRSTRRSHKNRRSTRRH